MIKRLRRKFVFAAMLSLFIVLAALVVTINVMNYRSAVREADDTLLMLSELDPNVPDGFFFDREDVRPDLSDFGKQPGQRKNWNGERPYQARYFSVVVSESGEAVETDLQNIVTVNEQTAAEMAQKAAKTGRSKGFIGDYRYLGVPLDGGTRWIFLNREVELSTFRSFLWTSIGISFVGFAMVFLLLALLSARIVRPIAQSYEKQKQFITDAGHELKTPITIIRADTDVIGEDVGENEWLSDIRTQTDRLAALTNDLVYLSRMEEAGAKPKMLEFPLSDVVADAVQPFRSVARTQNKAFSADIQPALTLRGDEKSIRKLVSILLDNAMKYTPDGGDIAFSLKKNGRQIRLVAANTAANVEKGSQDRLFDRFYRADASRNSETGGFGLGLSIAKAVTDAHKGKIRAYSTDGQSLTVEATFTE